LVLAFGAEDKGLRRLVRENCDALVALPAPGRIKSLNVSNAAAIAFYERARRSSS
jgi:23S rRNA (guanosine2251-2'-O)-methyltransferase